MINPEQRQGLHDKNDRLFSWYGDKVKNIEYPVYSSYDIRDSGFKVSNVDANIYPAGFHNLCVEDKRKSIYLISNYFKKHFPSARKILLLTEEHTKNPHYWDNVAVLRDLVQESGLRVLVGIPRRISQPLLMESARGIEIEVHSAFGDSAAISQFSPDLVISNNDFSKAQEEWAATIQCPIIPPRGMGWYQRKKSRYFKHYNQIVSEFSSLMGLDPFLLNIRTEVFDHFQVESENSRKALALAVDEMLSSLKESYKERSINQEPFVFLKNNSGTYGLAVIRVGSGREILEWGYKSRKKMKAAKEGRKVEQLILQEGIPSQVKSEGTTAEPVIYMIGTDLAGGLLRTHPEKNSTESLNSPGAVYKQICLSDLDVSLSHHPLRNVYGWSARLGLLAIGYEAQEMGVFSK